MAYTLPFDIVSYVSIGILKWLLSQGCQKGHQIQRATVLWGDKISEGLLDIESYGIIGILKGLLLQGCQKGHQIQRATVSYTEGVGITGTLNIIRDSRCGKLRYPRDIRRAIIKGYQKGRQIQRATVLYTEGVGITGSLDSSRAIRCRQLWYPRDIRRTIRRAIPCRGLRYHRYRTSCVDTIFEGLVDIGLYPPALQISSTSPSNIASYIECVGVIYRGRSDIRYYKGYQVQKATVSQGCQKGRCKGRQYDRQRASVLYLKVIAR